jgi:hypothetical protein
MRAFIPRTADWEKLIVDLLASPYVGWDRGMKLSTVMEVVGRIDQYEGDGAELAWEVLADTAKSAEIAQLRADGVDEPTIVAFVDDALLAKANEARVRASHLAEQERLAREAERTERHRAGQLEADWESERQRAGRLKEGWDTERRRREGLESDLERERRLRDQEKADLEAELAKAKRAAEVVAAEAKQQRQILADKVASDARRRRRVGRVVSAATLGVIAVAGVVALMGIGAVNEPLQRTFVILGGVALVATAANVGLGDRWAGRVLNVAGVVVGVAGLLVPLLFSGGH